jgi:hypothetical protein
MEIVMGKGGYCSEIEFANIILIDLGALIIALFGPIIDVGCT